MELRCAFKQTRNLFSFLAVRYILELGFIWFSYSVEARGNLGLVEKA